MLTIGTFEDAKWKESILPELLWIALLNDRHGLKLGARLSLSVAKAAIDACQDTDRKRRPLYAGLSSFASLDDAEQKAMTELLRQQSFLEPVRDAILPLVSYYPECPLAFLFESNGAFAPKPDIANFKSLLAQQFNRWDKPATMVQANTIYIAFVTGKLYVVRGLALSNFTEIQNFPTTEESKRVASAVRATVSTFFGGKESQNLAWPAYFWNRGIDLEECSTDE